ncbi:hypothetical protein LCGC14_0692130 [marine sediment metagenome]|uniref:PD-(D/E)XK endonuclease-like domain-containing protein n=1 Tax=marine sediment metagenome TaxID=412755 RepID=A0A0F9TT32_9ZZZZ
MSPLVNFICPDKEIRSISECLVQCPRPEGRCLSLPTLHTVGKGRKWKGKTSTTQDLNPTRMEYLQITKPYGIDPFSMAFALLGTRHHGRLEEVAKKLEGLKAELKVAGEVTGIIDLLEPINGKDEYRLIDYKTFGSYAVAKQMNIKEGGEYDRLKLALQTNNYRIMASDLGFNITELWCQITVRDGNTQSAHQNGIHFNLIMLPVKILDDEYVREYFLTKSFALVSAVEKGVMPELCDFQERWNGRRCKGYCSVSKFCPEGAKVTKVTLEE